MSFQDKLSTFFSNKYNKNYTFMFSHIKYDMAEGYKKLIGNEEKEEVALVTHMADVPILVPTNEYDNWTYEEFLLINANLKIKDIIDTSMPNCYEKIINNINNILPKEVIVLSEYEFFKAMECINCKDIPIEFINLGGYGDGRVIAKLKTEESNLIPFPIRRR